MSGHEHDIDEAFCLHRAAEAEQIAATMSLITERERLLREARNWRDKAAGIASGRIPRSDAL